MTIADVIAALTERLGPPAKAGTFKGQPCASWGRCSYLTHGVDCYTNADGSTRVATWQPISSTPMRLFFIDCADVPGSKPFRSSAFKTFATAEGVDAYDGILWPAIVPLDVAIEFAVRAMAGAR